MDGRNLVENYFKKKIPKKPADFIIAVMGDCIECELRGVQDLSLTPRLKLRRCKTKAYTGAS